jgi:hypothetical protein
LPGQKNKANSPTFGWKLEIRISKSEIYALGTISNLQMLNYSNKTACSAPHCFALLAAASLDTSRGSRQNKAWGRAFPAVNIESKIDYSCKWVLLGINSAKTLKLLPERCRSGLSSRFRKPVCSFRSTAGSNPALSAIFAKSKNGRESPGRDA